MGYTMVCLLCDLGLGRQTKGEEAPRRWNTSFETNTAMTTRDVTGFDAASSHGFREIEPFSLHLGLMSPYKIGCGFLLTIGSFLLTVELFYLQLTILVFSLTIGVFTYNWSFFAYSGRVHLIRALRDCRQRSLTVSKKTPTVSKKTSPYKITQRACRE